MENMMTLTIDTDLTNRINKGIESAKSVIAKIEAKPEHHQDKELLEKQYNYISKMNKSLDKGFIA